MSFAVPPPPAMQHQQLHRPQNFQILLTNVPECLQSPPWLREWIIQVASARSILLIPPNKNDAASTTNRNQDTVKSENSAASDRKAMPVSALITTSHPEAAVKLLTAIRHFANTLKNKSSDDSSTSSSFELDAFAVPTNPDVPLPPPPVIDTETVETLSKKLAETFEKLKQQKQNEESHTTETSTANDTGSKASVTKLENAGTTTIAPTVGENADGEEDPLESPAVLELVRKFRDNLKQQQGSKAVRRQQLVAEKLASALPAIRERVKAEKQKQHEQATNALVPPPPGALPPPPPGVSSGAPAVVSTSQERQVSNLPAWMTTAATTASSDQPPNKKPKLDDDGPTVAALVFPTIPPNQHEALRQFIASEIQRYLGEEETTLIDFVFQHVVGGQKSVAALQTELPLDDDAAPFVAAVLEKANQLIRSSD